MKLFRSLFLTLSIISIAPCVIATEPVRDFAYYESKTREFLSFCGVQDIDQIKIVPGTDKNPGQEISLDIQSLNQQPLGKALFECVLQAIDYTTDRKLPGTNGRKNINWREKNLIITCNTILILLEHDEYVSVTNYGFLHTIFFMTLFMNQEMHNLTASVEHKKTVQRMQDIGRDFQKKINAWRKENPEKTKAVFKQMKSNYSKYE